MEYPRLLAPRIQASLVARPVVLVIGARQSGKTTLVRQVAPNADYYNLDEARVRSIAADDPDGFVAAAGEQVIIDEVHRVPELLLSIKAAVDRKRMPGRFLLTGSADVMTLPRVADSLAGRVHIHRLRPLAQAEIAGAQFSFIDDLFAGERPTTAAFARSALVDSIVRGGFPEANAMPGDSDRYDWFDSYLDTVIHRGLRDIADLRYLDDVPRLLSLIAAASPGNLNLSALSNATGIPRTSIDRYLIVLHQTFMVAHLAPWFANIATRQIKGQRFLLSDAGLMAHLLGEDTTSLSRIGATAFGRLVETLVATELLAHSGWSGRRTRMHWWRTVKGAEVDFVIEGPGGRIAAVEVKSSGTVRPDDFRHLRRLQAATGERFARGVVLYVGDDIVPVAPGLEAWPIASLWQCLPFRR